MDVFAMPGQFGPQAVFKDTSSISPLAVKQATTATDNNNGTCVSWGTMSVSGPAAHAETVALLFEAPVTITCSDASNARYAFAVSMVSFGDARRPESNSTTELDTEDRDFSVPGTEEWSFEWTETEYGPLNCTAGTTTTTTTSCTYRLELSSAAGGRLALSPEFRMVPRSSASSSSSSSASTSTVWTTVSHSSTVVVRPTTATTPTTTRGQPPASASAGAGATATTPPGADRGSSASTVGLAVGLSLLLLLLLALGAWALRRFLASRRGRPKDHNNNDNHHHAQQGSSARPAGPVVGASQPVRGAGDDIELDDSPRARVVHLEWAPDPPTRPPRPDNLF